MKLFFDEPSKNFQIREISRLTKIAVTSVKKYLNELLKDDLLMKDKKTLYPSYVANQQNRIFKIHKQQLILLELYTSGLIDLLKEELHPKCIFLFGSMSKGEYDKTSDIDLFVQCEERKINMSKFENKLKHNINIFFENNLSNLSNELFNNIINGVKIDGYLKLK